MCRDVVEDLEGKRSCEVVFANWLICDYKIIQNNFVGVMIKLFWSSTKSFCPDYNQMNVCLEVWALFLWNKNWPTVWFVLFYWFSKRELDSCCLMSVLRVHQSKLNIHLQRMNNYTDGCITQTTLIVFLVALNVYLNVIFSFTPTWIWTPESDSSDLTQCWVFPLVGLRGFSLHWSEPKRLCHHSAILTLKIRTSTNYFPQIPLKRP